MRPIILSVLFTVLFIHPVNAEPKDLHEMGIKGMELVMGSQFEEADKISDEMIRMEPENAIGYFIKTKNNFWMCAFGNMKDEYIKNFVDSSFKTIDISRKMLDKNKDDANALFYMGNAYLFLGRWYGEDGSWLKAFWYGRKGTNYLKKALKKDPGYYDAYLGTGIYKYYADVLPRFIKSISFLLGLGGDREEGIKEVKLASLKGDLTRDEAKFVLAQAVYYEIENDFEAALPLFEELEIKYPDNPNIKIPLIQTYRKLYKYDPAVEAVKKALKIKSLDKFPELHTMFYRYLGNTYADMNEYDKAVQAFDTAITLLESQNRTKTWEYDGDLYFMGDACEMLGEIDKAREYYSKVSKDDKTGAFAGADARLKNPLTTAQKKLIRGRNYSRYEKYSLAEPIFNELIASEKKNNPVNNTFLAEVCFNLGILKYNRKEYQDAIRIFDKVLTLNDVKASWIKPWTHCFIGHCYRDKGDAERALKEYDIAYNFEGSGVRNAVDKARKKLKK